MHEYSLMENVLESVTRDLEKRGVTSPDAVKEMILRVGALDIHSEESFRQAFTMIAQDSLLRNAILTLHIIPSRIECDKCGYTGDVSDELDGHDPNPVAECPRCGAVSMVVGGRGVDPIELVLDDDAPTG
jgi:hydrogenase nickel insertion protein HypA